MSDDQMLEDDDNSRRSGRACDGCRVRKRKCDGLQPFCTNCIKSVVRGSDGNPVCTYHTEAKKRGPRPGYKDKMLQRLERLESILKPLVDHGSPSVAAMTASPSSSSSASMPTPMPLALTQESSAPGAAGGASLSVAVRGRKKPMQRVLDLLDAIEGAGPAMQGLASNGGRDAMDNQYGHDPSASAHDAHGSASSANSATPSPHTSTASHLHQQSHPNHYQQQSDRPLGYSLQQSQPQQQQHRQQYQQQSLKHHSYPIGASPASDASGESAHHLLHAHNHSHNQHQHQHQLAVMPSHYYQQSHEQQSHPSQHRQHHATHTQQQQSTHQAPNRSLLVDLPDPSSRMHASATSSESLPAASTMHHHVHDQPSGHSSASATSLLGPQRVLSWSQPSTTSAQHHATLSALGHSGAHPSIDTDPSSFFLGGSAQLFSSLIQPPIIDPFPSIFPGTFIPTPSLSNLALFESSMMQQNSLQAVEDHLLMLGLTYNQVVPLATQHSLDLLSPPQRSLASIPRALQDALIAMGVFFSTHTDLFSSMLDQQGLSSAPSVSSPSSPPGSANAARIRIARIYILRARKALNAHVAPPGSTHLTSSSDAADGLADEPLDDCDAVRIMLLLATICYGLGDGGDSMQLIADAYRLAQKSRIYESSLPPTKASLQPPLTVDALVVSVPRMIGKKPTPRKLTPTEKFDRRVLWGSCLIVDTYCAMASGYQLGIDEGDYPHLVAGYNFSDLLPHISRLSSQQRLSASDLAEHTLWENSPLAVMFDDVSEMSLTSMASNLFTGEFESEVQLTVIMRRILRYVRSREASLSVAFSSSHFDRFPENLRAIYSTMQQSDDTASLHDSLLAWYSHYPARYCAFPSLEVFAIGVHQSSLDKFRDWAYNLYVVESILTFLSAFSYLHLPLISSPDADRKMYRLSCPPHASASASGTPGDDHQLHGDGTAGSANVSTASGHGGKRAQGQFRANGDAPISANTPIGGEEHLWSSRQVLLACFRALTYMIQRLYTPTTPLQSPFQAGVYEGERLAFCQRQPLSIDTPSPALCWTIHSVNVYIVSSAALMAVRSNSSSSNSGPGSGGGSGGISANAGIGIQPAPTGTGRVSDEEQLQSSQYEAVTRLIKTLVLPSLERIGKVWPMAQLYQFKLATLLKGGTAEEWAKEAKTYTL